MSFQATAQDLIVFDQSMVMDNSIPLDEILEVHSPENHSEHNHEEHELQVSEPVEGEIEFIVEDIPGAPPGTRDPEPEPALEVVEEEQKVDDTDSKKSKKWDWETKGATGFIAWIKERLSDVPKHSGIDSAGLERAISYMEKLDNEISRAMRLDLDGELDANKIEEVRAKIDDGITRIQQRLNKIKDVKKSNRKKKSDYDYSIYDEVLIKEAQKITGVQGTYVMVPLLISGIARLCINGTVSAGHDINDIYQRQVKKYNLNDRERSEVAWLLFDMGYPIRGDRGYYPDEDYDTSSSDNFDFMANYRG